MTLNFDKIMEAAINAELDWAALYSEAGVKLAHASPGGVGTGKAMACHVPPALTGGKEDHHPSGLLYMNDGTFAVLNGSTPKDRYSAIEALSLIRGVSMQVVAAEIAKAADMPTAGGTVEKAPESPPNALRPIPFPNPYKDAKYPGSAEFAAAAEALAANKPGIKSAAVRASEGVFSHAVKESQKGYAARCREAISRGEPKPARKEFDAISLVAHRWDPDPADPGWVPSGVQSLPASGGTLPTASGGAEVKALTATGSSEGIVFARSVGWWGGAKTIIKTEGPGDMLALSGRLWGDGKHPPSVAVITNINGCQSIPADLLRAAEGRELVICHDADLPGQQSAQAILFHCVTASPPHPVRNLEMPFQVEESHGKDIRDLIVEDTALDANVVQHLISSSPLLSTPAEVADYCITWYCEQGFLSRMDKNTVLMQQLVALREKDPDAFEALREHLKAKGLPKGRFDAMLKKFVPKKKKGKARPTVERPLTEDEFKQAMGKMDLALAGVEEVYSSRRARVEHLRTGHSGLWPLATVAYQDLRGLAGSKIDSVVVFPGTPPEEAAEGLISFETWKMGLLDAVAQVPAATGERVGDGLHRLGAERELVLVRNRRFYPVREGQLTSHRGMVLHGRAIHYENQKEWIDIDRLNENLRRYETPKAREELFAEIEALTGKWLWEKGFMARTAACLPSVVWLQDMLPNRGHVLLHGESQAGKSQFCLLLDKLLCGQAPLRRAQTWKGVKNVFGSTSLPLVLDEFDTVEPRHRRALFLLFRGNSDGAATLTSNSAQQAVVRELRHVAILCGIGNPASEQADLNRQIPLSLVAPEAGQGTLREIVAKLRSPEYDRLGPALLAATMHIAEDVNQKIITLLSQVYDSGIHSRTVEVWAPFWAVGTAFTGKSDKAMMTSFAKHMADLKDDSPMLDCSRGETIFEQVRNTVIEWDFDGTHSRIPYTIGSLLAQVCDPQKTKKERRECEARLPLRGVGIIPIETKDGPMVAFSDECLTGRLAQLRGMKHANDDTNPGLVLTYLAKMGGCKRRINQGGWSGRMVVVPSQVLYTLVVNEN